MDLVHEFVFDNRQSYYLLISSVEIGDELRSIWPKLLMNTCALSRVVMGKTTGRSILGQGLNLALGEPTSLYSAMSRLKPDPKNARYAQAAS